MITFSLGAGGAQGEPNPSPPSSPKVYPHSPQGQPFPQHHHQHQPQYHHHYEPEPTLNTIQETVTSPAFGYMPVCQWSCRRVPTHPLLKICDDLNGAYTSDCEFYKAVCRAEMRGLLLRRAPCQRSIVSSKRRQTWLKK